jgi:signal transduction histidine kinase/phage shock protein PspC (stress-responsive transcriptional regulator)
MATVPRHDDTQARRLLPRRDAEHKVLAGVCAGIGRELGVDPLIVRIVFLALATGGGVGIALYAICVFVMPEGDEEPVLHRLRTRRRSIQVALGTGLLVLSVLLTFRALGLWFADAIVWPLVLVTAGATLLWRQSQQATGAAPAVDAPGAAPTAAAEPGTPRETRAALVSRTGIGIALVIAAGVVFLQATGALSAARDVVLAALVVAVVVGVIFAPWIVRLARSLAEERSSRIRSQERAEMAAHLHDSVLQTLALVQQRAEDPRAVAALARRQERELRGWLAGRTASGAGEQRLGAALEAVADEVEQAHGVTVEVIVTGDRVIDERGLALVAAAREAVVNAAKFGGGSEVSVFAEAGGDDLRVFVRDRGPGFDLAAVPPDRRGVRESILGRMARHGGHAVVHSATGTGTEVELSLPAVGS